MSDNIQERIKKLLRLSRDGNTDECQSALRRAFYLAARYRVSIDEMDLDDDQRALTHKRHPVGRRFTLIRKCALGILQTHFNVLPVISYPDVVLVGSRPDIEIGEYVFDFVSHACSRGLSKFAEQERRTLSKSRRASFIHGFFYGVASNLKTACADLPETATHALVARTDAERRKQYFLNNFGLTKTAKQPAARMQHDAIQVGYLRGRHLSIHKGMGPAAENRQLAAVGQCGSRSSTDPC